MSVDVEQATARDPLRPTLLHLLRASMTPDTDAIVDDEVEELGRYVDGLRPEDRARLLTLGMSTLALASPAELGALNLYARRLELDLRVVIPR